MLETNTVALPPVIIFCSLLASLLAERGDNGKSHLGGPLLSRRPKLFVPSIVLDKASDTPLHRQIYGQIAQAIRSGSIPGGVRLPSSRVLAQLLGVSRNTVLAAFDDLAADDLLRGEQGAGMHVNGGAAVPEVTWFGLKQAIRASGYPARVVSLSDPDGNPIHLNF
jgi:DNA-binding transcriptional regulator YhcF (GntR family)